MPIAAHLSASRVVPFTMAAVGALVLNVACGEGDAVSPDAGAATDGGPPRDARTGRDGSVPRSDGGGGPMVQSGDLAERIFLPRFVRDGEPRPSWQRSGLFWLGRVDSSNNYTEARVGYGAERLTARFAVFDQRIYDDATDERLDQWDSITLYVDVDGRDDKSAIDARSFRFDAQAHRHGSERSFAYGGAGGRWTDLGLALDGDPATARTGITFEKAYRGEDRDNSRGWHVIYHLGFAALGLPGEPGPGEKWRVAVVSYDRDDAAGTRGGEPQRWPPSFDDTDPSTWARWEFLGAAFAGWDDSGSAPGAGRPAYAVGYDSAAHRAGSEQTLTIREGLAGAVVDNAAVGASEQLCSGNDGYNFGDGARSWGGNTSREFFHVQNQGDYADWPCFARIYLRFPLATLPAGKIIVAARLILHHKFPTSGGDEGDRTLLHAFAVAPTLGDGATPWSEANITWNDGPPTYENLAGTWGDRVGQETTGWDHLPEWSWDVSRAVARANGQQHVAFALYSTDMEYHTGKSFVTSEDFPDWGDPSQRPTLEIVYADAE